MTLYFYFAKRFLAAFFKVLAILFILIFVIETLEQIRVLAKYGVSFSQSAYLAVFSAPSVLLKAMPIVVMLAGLTFCVGLARSNEFVVTRAVGVPALNAMFPPAAAAFTIGLIAIFFFNPLSAVLKNQYEILRANYSGAEPRAVSFGEDGFWLRQKDSSGHTVIHAESANSRGTSLRGATALSFDENGDLTKRFFSRTAILRKGEWVFTNGKFWRLGAAIANPESTSETFEISRFPTDITPEQILEGYPTPESVPIWNKAQMIRTIAKAGFSTLPHRLHFQMEMARPLMLVAMMIIGAAFTLQTARMGNMGISVFLALMCGFSLYFLQNLAMTLGEAGEVPVLIAAWAPPIAAFLLAVGLFLKFEDG